MASPGSRPAGENWRIEISHSAEKIKKFDQTAQKSIVRFLREQVRTADNPRQWGKPIHGDKGELWRYRVGNCRLICRVANESVRVLAVSAGQRKDVNR